MIGLDELRRWRPENQENLVDALDREIDALIRLKESGGGRARPDVAPVAGRYLFLCADLDTVIEAVKHVARAKRIAAERVRAAKVEVASVVADIEARGWAFTIDRDEVWVDDPAATWESDADLRQIGDRRTAMAERLAAALIDADDANVDLNRQTYAARRATSRLVLPALRRGEYQQSQLPTHGWAGHRQGHHEVMPKPRRCGNPGCEKGGIK